MFRIITSDNTTLYEHKRMMSSFGPDVTTYEQLTELFLYVKSPYSVHNNICFIRSYSMAVI